MEAHCPQCSETVILREGCCPSCGQLVDNAIDATETFSPSGEFADKYRWKPGDRVDDRYELQRPLGRGGMGEVHLALDGKLDLPVALKFLPTTERSPALTTLLYDEARRARRVTHPNVCRVFDIGESGGEIYLSMEYVDGENLATYIQRTGASRGGEATSILTQICLGVAAIHRERLLHRDLKPANVLIDRSGRVKISDFGLAAPVDEQIDSIAGTPRYMAPELTAGGQPSVQSDLYALGLTAQELLVGDPAREGSAHDALGELAPDLQLAIRSCLSQQPSERPDSALALAARIPGSQLLSERLLAGETPTPEQVAAAGSRKRLSPLLGAIALAVVMLGLAVYVFFAGRLPPSTWLALDKSPQVLRDRSEQLVETLRLPAAQDSAHGFQFARRQGDLGVRYWYRRSVNPPPIDTSALASDAPIGSAPNENLQEYGDALIRLDSEGKLLELHSLAPPTGSAEPALSLERRRALLTAAQAPEDAWQTVSPNRSALNPELRLYTWIAPGDQRFEASERRGYVERFVVSNRARGVSLPDNSIPPPQPHPATVAIGWLISLAMLLGVGLLAWGHWRSGRGDRAGAIKIAMFVFLTRFGELILLNNHSAELRHEILLWAVCLLAAFAAGLVVWPTYLAVEPLVRRWSPQLLIAWNRLLAGNLRDSLIGRDVLVGGVFAVLAACGRLMSYQLGAEPARDDIAAQLIAVMGNRAWLGHTLHLVIDAATLPVLLMAMLVITQRVVRNRMIGAALLLALLLIAISLGYPNRVSAIYNGALLAAILAVLLRFGFLATAVGAFLYQALVRNMLTIEITHWYGGVTIMTLLLFVVLMGSGFLTAVALPKQRSLPRVHA